MGTAVADEVTSRPARTAAGVRRRGRQGGGARRGDAVGRWGGDAGSRRRAGGQGSGCRAGKFRRWRRGWRVGNASAGTQGRPRGRRERREGRGVGDGSTSVAAGGCFAASDGVSGVVESRGSPWSRTRSQRHGHGKGGVGRVRRSSLAARGDEVLILAAGVGASVATKARRRASRRQAGGEAVTEARRCGRR